MGYCFVTKLLETLLEVVNCKLNYLKLSSFILQPSCNVTFVDHRYLLKLKVA